MASSLDFFAGCLGGAAGVLVGHPLDTVKVRLQTQSPDNIKYRGTFHCLQTIVKAESTRGLYKGMSSPLLGVAGVNALIFGVYGSLRPYVSGAPGNDTLWAHFAAGSISGGVQSFVASPMELVKTRMQLNESSLKAPTSLDVLKGIYKSEGGIFRGVFKGWGITVAREIPGFGIYFATYEALTSKSGYQVGTLGMMMAGGMAGVASWIFTFPIDVLKTRLQSDVTGRYAGALDCCKKTWKAEGYKAFTRGLVSTVIRAFPTNAATFTVVTWIMRWAEEKQGNEDGRRFLEQVLKESANAQERIENAVRSKLPHYLYHGSVISLSNSCATMAHRYSKSTQDYLSFSNMLDDTSIRNGGGGSGGFGSGIIKERMLEAFNNNSKSNKVDQQLNNNDDTSLSLLREIRDSNSIRIELNEQEKLSHGTSSSLPVKEDLEANQNQRNLNAMSKTLDIPVHILKAAAPNPNHEISTSNATTNTFTPTNSKSQCIHHQGKEKSPSNSVLTLFSSLVDFFVQSNIVRIGLCKCLDDNCVCFS